MPVPSPGTAATPIARASATAIEVTNDGHGESSSGTNEPAVTALGGARA